MMIGVNTLTMSLFVCKRVNVYTHISSTSPFCTSTSTSTLECSLVQLSMDIDFIYQDLTTDTEFSMSLYRLAVIQQKRVSGSYVLCPLRVKFIKKVNLHPFLYDTLPDCPDIMIGHTTHPDILCVVMPHKDDVLVLMGLSLMLLRISHGDLPNNGYRIESTLSSFYSSFQQLGKVDRLYKVDFMPSLRILPISLILDKVKPFVGEGPIYNLIESFLSLPIIDDDGKNRAVGGIPSVGEITRVLFNIVLMDIFDREFRKRYPGITFSRYINDVFISTHLNDEVIFNEKVLYVLLKELCLVGNIVSMGPNEKPLPSNSGMLLFLDSDRKVKVCHPEDFY